MTNRIAKAKELAADLEKRVRATSSLAEANTVTKMWYAEVKSLGDKTLTDLAYTCYSIIRHLETTGRAEAAEAAYVAKSGDVFVSGDLHVGDQYKAGQAGAMGPGAKASHMIFNQTWTKIERDVDLAALAAELALVRSEMKKRADGSVTHDKAIAAVGEAEEAAKEGNGPKALRLLKSAGKLALDVAKDVTADVAAKVIATSMGMSG